MKAVIVGASRGIGAATAHQLQRHAVRVTDLSRTSGVDATDRSALDTALDAVGEVDALVYCAGHVDIAPIEHIDDDAWDYHVDVNLTGAFRALRWFARQNRPGSVVLVASTAALRPSPEWGAYSATKAGMVNLALTAAEELADRRVRVYCVAPGRCATDLRARLAPDEDPATIMAPRLVGSQIAQLILGDHCGVLAGQVIEVKQRG